jgi:methyltransferase (TIGR00027 family)
VATVRAGFDRPHSPDGDPGAQAALCAGMRPAALAALRPHLAARTRFFDEQVLEAIERGVRQIVILGAGYDDRALRFRTPGVRFFELDHPDTQSDKRRRLKRIKGDQSGLILAPADFRHATVGDVLAANGHDAAQASLFICEGLLVYLDQATTVEFLAGLRSRATGESSLTASLAVHPEGVDSDLVAARANGRRPNAAAEPWRTILPAAGQRDLLARAGWIVEDYADDAKYDPTAAPGRSMLAVAHPGTEEP